ncbi:MAG: AAA family ATPase [Verrucomicrobia bacterium]|nr:AAA family ATPase [Verrucomicrobiota bacterium]
MSDKSLPTPDELQRKLSEFMRQQFGDKVNLHAAPVSAPQDAGDEVSSSGGPENSPFAFHYRPRDIKAHLDRFVIRQDEAKKVLSVAICDHYNHIRALRAAEEKGGDAPKLEYAKQNVILLGPTGVGKTYLVKHVAELIGVPFVKADATKFSETGYVGGDVDDLVRDLVRRADGDVELAQYGIIYLDEIDKIAGASNLAGGRDVSGRGVQTTLLKLMEETEVAVRSPMDMQGQIQAVMEMQRGGKPKRESINTRNILFIVSGAFSGLKERVARRLKQSALGFGAARTRRPEDFTEAEIFAEVTTRDFVDYGFEPEFIGRLPVRVFCQQLHADDLYEILQRSEGSLLRQYERSFAAYGIRTRFTEDAMREIARRAEGEGTGARGLSTVCERLLRDFQFELPGSGTEEFVIDAALLADPRSALQRLLAEGQQRLDALLAVEADEFAQEFSQRFGVELKFEQAARAALVARSRRENLSLRVVCEKLFKDYQFGLTLIQKNTGRSQFELPAAAIDDPDKYLSELVVESYRK